MQLKETIQEAAQFKVELCKSISLLMNEIIQYLCIQVIYISNIIYAGSIKNMHFLANLKPYTYLYSGIPNT